jgi:ankyrin repeat protein
MPTCLRTGLVVALLLATAVPARADLFEAINANDVAQVRKLLADDPALAIKPRDHDTPLHAAAGAGIKVEIAQLLLNAGADVNARADDDRTPLHFAARHNNKAVAEILIARGADLKAMTKVDGFTPLHYAALGDAGPTVALLLVKGADPDGGWDGKAIQPRNTPLQLAARNGYVEVARLLLAKGASVNAQQFGTGGTALSSAVVNRDMAMVKLLLARGADPNADFAFDRALQSGRRDLVDLFLATKVDAGKVEHLIAAASSGKKEFVELVLDKGADVNAVDRFGNTAVLTAARLGTVDVAALLLAKGAKVKVADNEGMTPLHAVGTKAVAEMLLAQGADVNAVNQEGETPLYLAVQRGDLPLAELLEAKGARHDIFTLAALGRDEALRKALQTSPLPKPKKNYHYPPLLLAAHFGQTNAVQVLLDKGAGVDDSMWNGMTALHAAAAGGHKDTIGLLLEHKANINAKMSGGPYDPMTQTPLEVALAGGHIEVVQLLRRTGALPKIEGPDALAKQLQRAAERKQLALVKLFLEEGAPHTTKVPPDQALPLHLAAAAGDLELAKDLLARGADVKALSGTNQTPLHDAVAGNHKAMVEFLLARGAKVNGDWRMQPLHVAAEQGHVAMADLLLARGADIDQRNSFPGYTALTLAASAGKLDMVKLLHARGADLHKDAGTLHLAAFHGHRAVVEFLLTKGCDVERFLPNGFNLYYWAFQRQLPILAFFAEKDKTKFKGLEPNVTIRELNGDEPFAVVGGTPFQAAVAGGQKAVAELLLARGAKVNARFPDGSVPLHLAAALGDVEMVRLLIANGADINARNRAGATALGVAVDRDEAEVAALLRKHGAKQ